MIMHWYKGWAGLYRVHLERMFIIENKRWNKASVRSVVSEFGPKAEQACTESIRQNRSCVSFTAGNWRISRCLQVMSEKIIFTEKLHFP